MSQFWDPALQKDDQMDEQTMNRIKVIVVTRVSAPLPFGLA